MILGGKSRGPGIGLDIGGSGVRGAVVVRRGGDLVVTKIGQVALQPGAVREGQIMQPETVTQAVRELRQALKLGKAPVVLGCEQLRTFVRAIDLPWIPPKNRIESLPLLAADVIPMSPEEAVVDFVELGEVAGEDGGRLMTGLLIAASAEAVTMQVEAVRAAGLKVAGIDLSAFALVRSIGRPVGDPSEGSAPEALVDVGAGMTTVVIHAGGVPSVVRILPRGEDLVVDRLVADIRSSLDYQESAYPGKPLSRVAVTGGWASSELLERLADEVDAQVDFESAFRNVTLGPVELSADQIRVLSATGAVCIGLAMGRAA